MKIWNSIMGWVDRIWSIGFVQFLVYLALAFIAGWIASAIVKAIFKGLKLDKKLDKWGVNEGQSYISEASSKRVINDIPAMHTSRASSAMDCSRLMERTPIARPVSVIPSSSRSALAPRKMPSTDAAVAQMQSVS